MSKKIFFTIGEVSDIVGVDDYTLRYWEKEFKQLSPRRRRGGVRMYVIDDIQIIKRIKYLLYNRKFTIEGAKMIMDNKLESEEDFIEYLDMIKYELSDILKDVRGENGA